MPSFSTECGSTSPPPAGEPIGEGGGGSGPHPTRGSGLVAGGAGRGWAVGGPRRREGRRRRARQRVPKTLRHPSQICSEISVKNTFLSANIHSSPRRPTTRGKREPSWGDCFSKRELPCGMRRERKFERERERERVDCFIVDAFLRRLYEAAFSSLFDGTRRSWPSM